MSEPLTTEEIRDAYAMTGDEDAFDAWHDGEVARIETRAFSDVFDFVVKRDAAIAGDLRREFIPDEMVPSLLDSAGRHKRAVTIEAALIAQTLQADHDAILRDIADTLATLADRVIEAVGDE